MTALVLKRESDNYRNLIKDASNEVKLALIKRLSDALRPTVAKGMIMVTENVKDFQNIQGIQIENWIERDKQQ